MGFRSRRGRPRNAMPTTDRGTPELRARSIQGMTKEPLDLCLAQGVIDEDQHWAGIHLRWLYTLRFGTPTVRALDPLHLGGRDLRPEHPEWKAGREEDYRLAMELLRERGACPVVPDLCLYAYRPLCLKGAGGRVDNVAVQHELGVIQEGLSVLAKSWGRR